ncbi:RTA1 like protein-domain-containing protein [Mycena vulgaris]|nr:RTA1 like protein-domain-containing protein [Mycena vulgaris]
MGTPLKINPYGYIPIEPICILFVALFGISTLTHLGQAIRHRLWWLLPSVVFAGCIETLGWSGRLWSSIDITQALPFEIQIIATICGPTPLAAANFMILGRIIMLLGPIYSRLTPKQYTTIFLICDIVSLFVQGIGGGIAARAVTHAKSPKLGSNIMLVGIILQLATIAIYTLCATEFLVRYLKGRPLEKYGAAPAPAAAILTPRLKVLLAGMGFNTLCLFIRAVYRVIELADGFKGRIIQTQVYFDALDGWMIVFAIVTLNLVHPGFMLYPRKRLEDGQQVGMVNLQGSNSSRERQNQ